MLQETDTTNDSESISSNTSSPNDANESSSHVPASTDVSTSETKGDTTSTQDEEADPPIQAQSHETSAQKKKTSKSNDLTTDRIPTAATHPAPTCWICYEAASTDRKLIAPCKCKGSVQFVHQDCLLEWLDSSDTSTCPHCHQTYDVRTTYPSTIHEWLDAPILPTVCAGLLVLGLFYLFHLLFTWAFRKFQRWRMASDRGRRGGGWYSPEFMTVLGSALPGSRPTLMLLRNGLDNVHDCGGGFGFGGLNFTLLFAEFELFAILLVGVYLLCVKVYESSSASLSTPMTTSTATDGDNDVHEGLATTTENNTESVSTNEDDTSNNGDNASFASPLATNTFGSLLDVIDGFWEDTNIGSAHGAWSDDAVYLFPFDVIQTTFYTLQHLGKQVQTSIVDKQRVVHDQPHEDTHD